MKPKPKKSATVVIVQEKRMPRKDGHYPVKLRVTYERDQQYYTIRYSPEKPGSDFTDYQKYWIRKQDKSISMTEQEFAFVFNKFTSQEQAEGKSKIKLKDGTIKDKDRKTNDKEPYQTMFLYLTTQLKDAQETIAKLSPFTFERFIESYFEKPTDDQDLLAAIDKKATKLRKDGKISTAEIYQNTLNTLKDFTKKDQLSFNKITPTFLEEFEKYLYTRTVGGKGKPKKNKPVIIRNISKTTVSMYLRSLRSVFNDFAPEGTAYPFGKGKYIIPSWNHNKRAITQAEVAKIAGYNVTDGTLQHKSRDLWLFSYLANGINFRDIANLKFSNIKNDTIVFERAKTAKSGQTTEIIVIITRQIGRILDQWKNQPGTPDQYIFPILTFGMTPEEQHRTVKQCVKNTNKYMKLICQKLEILESTTYVARHSFATVLKRSGASVEYISESLGHKNIATTQSYLSNFEIEEKRKWAEKLLPDSDSKQ